jgi:hypothetical protein
MASQWEPRRRADNPAGERVAQRTHTGIERENAGADRHIYGRSITRVEFFRRMPTGGATAYFKPVHPEA